MWQDVWPGVPVDEVPIAHVTNGVHPQSWISDDMRSLYDRYLGPALGRGAGRHARLGARRADPRRGAVADARAAARAAGGLRPPAPARRSSPRAGPGKAEIAQAEEVLDPEALTIGFARRFATYKRGTLLLRDPGAARADPQRARPAGADHLRRQGAPARRAGQGADPPGRPARARPEFRRRIVFLEDYDQVVARYLVQGVDVWLNTPRRPMEASGTSGMKAAFNGALNLSILDGWWDEAYSPRTGWAIGKGEDYQDHEYQDRVEAGALYDLLENEVVPLFYARGADSLPRGWIALMRAPWATLCPVFNTNRMVHQYVVEGYLPRRGAARAVSRRTGSAAREALAAWKEKVRRAWRGVRVARVEVDLPAETRVGGEFEVPGVGPNGGPCRRGPRRAGLHGEAPGEPRHRGSAPASHEPDGPLRGGRDADSGARCLCEQRHARASPCAPFRATRTWVIPMRPA